MNKDIEPYSHFFKMGDSGEFYMNNIDGVASCLCGHHPITSGPIVTKKNIGDDVIKVFGQLGPPRSGSTVAYQIMNELFPKKTEKSHEFKDICPFIHDIRKIVVTVRHPYDMAASMLRQNGNNVDSMLETFGKGMNAVHSSVGSTLLIGNCTGFIDLPSCKFLFLKYEDYYGNNLKRVQDISRFLEADISFNKAKEISEKFSIERNKNEKREGLQKNHIGPENGAPLLNFQSKVTNSIKDLLYREYKGYFDTFDYRR